MIGYKRIVCEICGKEAVVSKKRKLDYCNNPECEKEMKILKRKETMQRFNEKHGIEKVEQEETIKKPSTWQPVENRKVDTEAVSNLDVSDIRELARQLGSIRYMLIQLIEKEREKIENASKEDSTLIHSFEFENLTKEEVWQKYLETKERRVNRRQERYRYAIIKGLLDSIKVKNPDKYIVQAINGCKETRNFDEYIDELKKDKELFNI